MWSDKQRQDAAPKKFVINSYLRTLRIQERKDATRGLTQRTKWAAAESPER
jgi:hypothetical protein